MSFEKVTVAVITYNGEKLLEECLSAIKSLDYPDYEVTVVDNHSTDQSVNLVRKKFPEVKVWEMDENRGPNPARNTAILKSKANYVFLIDDDTVLTPHCLSVLMNAKNIIPDVAVCHPRIIYYDDRTRIQQEGAEVHYIGAAIVKNGDMLIKNTSTESKPTGAASGALLVDREKAVRIGLLDEDYFFGWTDGQFTFRLTASGFKCLGVPGAIVYHKATKRGLSKVFYQVRNRWYFILQVYSLRTIFLILPALAVYEISLLVFLTMKGVLLKYLKANMAVLQNFGKLMKKRQKIQSLKKVRDSELLHTGEIKIRQDLLDSKYAEMGTKLLNRLLDSYWKLIKDFL
ncbi:hypothetical protein ES702_00093 [subsurface metagenome]